MLSSLNDEADGLQETRFHMLTVAEEMFAARYEIQNLSRLDFSPLLLRLRYIG